jgi:hypothetical protein
MLKLTFYHVFLTTDHSFHAEIEFLGTTIYAMFKLIYFSMTHSSHAETDISTTTHSRYAETSFLVMIRNWFFSPRHIPAMFKPIFDQNPFQPSSPRT